MEHDTDVEKWGAFLSPINVVDIHNRPYQCNNQIILVPITPELRELCETKNKNSLYDYLSRYLQIDLTEKNYFVKLSTISGKDILDTELITEWSELNVVTKKLIIRSIDSLCEYLLNSERIALYIGDLETKYLVFREWIEFNVEEEFRCFIYQKKLVAVSQYDYGQALPESMIQPDSIVRCIQCFVDQVMKFILFDDVVLDVAVKLSNSHVYFIEFNPWGVRI